MGSPCIRKKVNVRITMSQYLVDKMAKKVGIGKKFSSTSDLISIAVAEFLKDDP